MGFYGRNYDNSINDYFNTIKFKKKQYDLSVPNEQKFPKATDNVLTDSVRLTATVPAQEIQFATGNPWIEFVVDTENADMMGAGEVAYGLTMYHKKADGKVEGKLIDFTKAVRKNGSEPVMDNTKMVLDYGGEISINTVSFDAAGHASGTQEKTLTYALPKIIEGSIGTTSIFGQAWSLQQDLAEEYNADKSKDLNEKIQNYPIAGSTLLPLLVQQNNGLTELMTIVKGSSNTGNNSPGSGNTGGSTDPEGGSGNPGGSPSPEGGSGGTGNTGGSTKPVDNGLIGKVDTLTEQVGNIESQIANDILPNLGQTPGINKPGLEFNHDMAVIQYQSPLANEQKINSGDHATVFNHYDINSIFSYAIASFSNGNDYMPNKYYIKDANNKYVLSTDTEYDSSKTYYEKISTNTLQNTNFALGNYSLAWGYGSRAIGDYSYAGNGYTRVDGYDTRVYPSIAYGTSAHAEGCPALALQPFNIEILEDGNFTITDSGFWTHLEKDGFIASSPILQKKALSIGAHISKTNEQNQTEVTYKIYPASVIDFNQGTFSIPLETDETLILNSKIEPIIGLAYGNYSHVEGLGTSAMDTAAHAEGKLSIAAAAYSHAEGEETYAEGIGSHAEGVGTTAKGEYSHAEGKNTSATGNYSHAEGEKSKTNAPLAHAEGNNTIAKGKASHSEGTETLAEGESAHAEGERTKATNIGAHAEGVESDNAFTEATGKGSHAEGGGTHAEADYSHSEGLQTIVKGHATAAHAGGQHTVAERESQTAIGRYNKVFGVENDSESTKAPLFVIGNGTADSERSDAFRVWDTADCEVMGELRVYGTGIRLKDRYNSKFYEIYIDQGQIRLEEAPNQ